MCIFGVSGANACLVCAAFSHGGFCDAHGVGVTFGFVNIGLSGIHVGLVDNFAGDSQNAANIHLGNTSVGTSGGVFSRVGCNPTEELPLVGR